MKSFILSTILLTSISIADDDFNLLNTLSLEEMMDLSISSSTGTYKPISMAPSIATVITDKDIARSNARTLGEILEKVPGVHVYLSNISNQAPLIDIRGIRTNTNPQVMILINGTSVQALKKGSPNPYFDIPLSAVKRIEVVRGPGSVVYGANALSGVINVITKDAEYLSQKNEAGFRLGSFNSGELWLNYGSIENGFSYAFNFSIMTSDGDNERIFKTDFQTILDSALPFNSKASLAPGPLQTEFKKYNLNANIQNGNFNLNIWANALVNAGSGSGVANALDPSGSYDNSRLHTDLHYTQRINENYKLEHKLSLIYNKTETYLNVFPAGAILPIGTDGNFGGSPLGGVVTFSNGYIGTPGDTEKTISYESTLIINKYNNQIIRLNGGYSYGKYEAFATQNFGPGVINGTEGIVDGSLTSLTGSTGIYMPNVNRKQFFISAQDEWSFAPNWELTAGIRYDNFSDFGSTVNPRLALVWQTSDKITSKLLYGRAFRAPSFTELYAQNNPVTISNKNIDPETIDTFELSFSYYPNSKLHSLIDFYYYKLDNLIEQIGNLVDNSGKQKGYGIEFEVSYQPSNEFTIKADYAYRYTKNEKTDNPVADAPKNLAHLETDWKLSQNLYANAELFWVANMKRLESDTRKSINNYTTVNATLSYRVKKDLTTNISARNLFNEDIREPSPYSALGELDDYPMQGRYIFGEIRYHF